MTNLEKREYLAKKFKDEGREFIPAIRAIRAANNNCGLMEAVDILYELESFFDGDLTVYVYDLD